MDQSLKYEFSANEVNFILGVLNKAQVSGVQTAQALIAAVEKLQSPLNKEEMDKEVYEQLKAKFEVQSEKKK